MIRQETRTLKDGREMTLFFDEDKQAYLVTGEVMDMAIKGLEEEKKYRWIPCSERLPENRDWCLAVFKEPDTGFIGIPHIADYLMGSHTAYTTDEGWIVANCTDTESESADYYKKLVCVAWMPLPEPYQTTI